MTTLSNDPAFALLVGFVVAFWVVASRRAAGGRAALLAALLWLGWLGVTWVAATRGLLTAATFPRLILPAMTFAFVLSLSRAGLSLAMRVPLAWLVGFQVFRVGVELWLHAHWRSGLVPVQMTYAGRNFDIVAGLTAPLVATLQPRLGRAGVLVWNIGALGLLANIVAIAVASLPGRHVFEGSSAFVLSAPYVWLPTALVLSALLGHLLVFRALFTASASASSPASSGGT